MNLERTPKGFSFFYPSFEIQISYYIVGYFKQS